jgi:acyl-CoA synthetase (AMP-forming)/AMP-acid ligase II
VQVIGKPDEKYGEVPVAFVELNPDASVGAEELMAFCRGALASFKLPREIRIVNEWPMSATKIQKHKLAELL